MDSPSWVHLGSWTNWERGYVRGASITLHDTHAAYLVAFLALFVRFAGQHSWDICCYLYFRLRQSSSKKDDFHQAQQVILRNTLTHTSGIWQFLRLGWTQRTKSENALLRALGLSLFALIHLLGFSFAGIFVSKVTDTGRQVLLRGPICGQWRDPGPWGEYLSGSPADSLENSQYGIYLAQTQIAAARFAANCYNTTSSSSALANCEAYGPRQVPWNVTTDIECPFASEMCRNQSVRFDTGYLDSQRHFGINSKAGDRIKYRRVVECAPVTQNGFASPLLNYSQVQLPPYQDLPFKVSFAPNQLFQEFYYGSNVDYGLNSTFLWSNSSVFPVLGDMEPLSFLLDGEIATLRNDASSTFIPVDQMNRTDADVVMYFLLNEATYLGEVHDPWFQATTNLTQDQPSVVLGGDPDINDHYIADYDVSVMGCTQQFQYCNHDASKCSPLTGSAPGAPMPQAMVNFQDGLDLNPKQQSIQERLYQASWVSDMYYANMAPAGQNLLVSSFGASSNYMPPFPDNQWLLEMQHFFLLGLTSMQMQVTEYVTGPPNSKTYQYLHKPIAENAWMCNNQIVQRAGFTTFSALGVALVVVIGGLLILINLFLTLSTTLRPISEWDKVYNLNLLYEVAGNRPISEQEKMTMMAAHAADYHHDRTRQESDATRVGSPITERKPSQLAYVNTFSNSEPDAASSSEHISVDGSGGKLSGFRAAYKRVNTGDTAHIH